MNNADMPAMPVNAQDYKDNGGHECDSFGLTKREHFAAMAIPPMELIIEVLKEHNAPFTIDDYLKCAVAYKKKEADALLKELEK